MKIESKNWKIKDVFSMKAYIIPDYQREYSWSVPDELETFWQDFMYYFNSTEDSDFFIGPMVFTGDNLNANSFEVVDGQQRLITISILLSVLVELFKSLGVEKLSNGLRQSLVFKNTKFDDVVSITAEDPYPYFQSKVYNGIEIEPTKEAEKLIQAAWNFFNSKILALIDDKTIDKKIERLELIRDKIFNIDTVIIVSDDRAEAFTIFETINTRGLDLETLDLLKNYIFKNYSKGTGMHEPSGKWKKILKNIEKDRDSFFNRFWASWVMKVPENKLYKRFLDYTRNKDSQYFKDANSLLDSLEISSEAYRKVSNPNLDDWSSDKNFDIYYRIKNITGLFGLQVHYSFFLSLIEEYESKRIGISQLRDILDYIENFHFVFTHIVHARASGLDGKYSKFAIRLRSEVDKNKVISELKDELKLKLPSLEVYKNNFIKLNFSENKESIKFVLLKLEKEKDPSITLDSELNSIEHLTPKSGGLLGKQNIGNLFLLEQKYNETKGDFLPFDIYGLEHVTYIEYLINNTKYKSTKNELESIMTVGKWDDDDITSRANNLAEVSYKIFSK